MEKIDPYRLLSNDGLVEAIVSAWMNDNHHLKQRKLAREWPTLTQAVENLVDQYRVTTFRYTIKVRWIWPNEQKTTYLHFPNHVEVVKAFRTMQWNLYRSHFTLMGAHVQISILATVIR